MLDDDLTIGIYDDGNILGAPFEGIIDEVSLYNRVLSSNEIIVLYQEYPPTMVYVDDDYTVSTPGWGYDHFARIQDGIDVVYENGIVYIYSGVYNESIFINNSMNLIGEDK